MKRKKKSEKESCRTGVRTQERCTRIVLATHHATHALATFLACMDLINLTVQYRYATITQRYRVQRVNDTYCKYFRCLTAEEATIDGLRTGKGPKLEIFTGDSAGRGVLAAEKISKGQFVCEYKTSYVYQVADRPEKEARHEKNGLGCFIVETQHAVPGFGHLCFDASERLHHPGRYINHVYKGPTSV